jgi:hypothetical protein
MFQKLKNKLGKFLCWHRWVTEEFPEAPGGYTYCAKCWKVKS